MADIRIYRRGNSPRACVSSLSPKGCAWLKENMIISEGVEVVYITEENAEEVAQLIKKSGLIVED